MKKKRYTKIKTTKRKNKNIFIIYKKIRGTQKPKQHRENMKT